MSESSYTNWHILCGACSSNAALTVSDHFVSASITSVSDLLSAGSIVLFSSTVIFCAFTFARSDFVRTIVYKIYGPVLPSNDVNLSTSNI